MSFYKYPISAGKSLNRKTNKHAQTNNKQKTIKHTHTKAYTQVVGSVDFRR